MAPTAPGGTAIRPRREPRWSQPRMSWNQSSRYSLGMHRIQPARLKPGVTLDSIPSHAPAEPGRAPAPVIRGKSLIFWDLKILGKRKKLDAIDTDQITPAADCVSESLDTLDERWKAGAFRYLMPDFRARVHRGE